MKPILFVLGPSGVGKSHLSRDLQKRRLVPVHIDTDRATRTFAANGFPKEWDDDFQNVNLGHLVSVLRDRISNERAGVVVSFPTVHLFTPEMLGEASKLGVTPLILWGTREHCMKAAEARIQRKGMSFNRSRYERLNEPTFQAYSGREYNSFRVEAFRQDGSRFPVEELAAQVMLRTAAG